MNSKCLTKKTKTISLLAVGLLAAANAVTLTSAANALASHVDGLRPSTTVAETPQTNEWQVAEAQEGTKKKKKKKKRRGSFHGG